MEQTIATQFLIVRHIKTLRRFAGILSDDVAARDAAVLEALTAHKKYLRSVAGFKAARPELLLMVFENLYAQDRGSPKLSLLRPERSGLTSFEALFHSLDFKSRAIMALYLLEELPIEMIAAITKSHPQQISDAIERHTALLVNISSSFPRVENLG